MTQNTTELDDDTERYMYDRMTDIGGLSDRPVNEAVEALVRDMRANPNHEYDAPTEALVDAAYDAAEAAIQAEKEMHAPDIVAEIEGEE